MPERASRRGSEASRRSSDAAADGSQAWLSGVAGNVTGRLGGGAAAIGGISKRDDSQGNVFAELPVMKGSGEVLIDDNEAAVMMELLYDPEKEKDDPAMDEVVNDPMESAKKIFDRSINAYSKATMQEGFDALKASQVSFRVYRDVIRQNMFELMEVSGFKLSTITTVDKDRILLRISMEKDKQVIQQIAERFDYDMQFNSESYHGMDGLGKYYPGHEPPKNAEGDEVATFAPFRQSISSRFVPFTEVDEIRLIFMQINDWMKLDELQAQNIICSAYPAADFGKMCVLSSEWANFAYCHHLPTHHHDDLVRDYFGEKVAFFFKFWAFYCRCLAFLAAFAVLPFLASIFASASTVSRVLILLFFVVTTVWSALFNQYFRNHQGRDRQIWGVEDCSKLAHTRSDWNPFLEGTWGMVFRNILVICLVLGFISGFLFCLGLIGLYSKRAHETGDADYSAIMITVLMKVGGMIYGRAVPIWVKWQNHRTEDRYDDSLNLMLVLLRLFIALWPLLNLAFFVSYLTPECADTLEEAANTVYGGHWPPGTPGDKDFSWLDTPTFTYRAGNKTCIYGCFPVQCDVVDTGFFVAAGDSVCKTGCVKSLESTLVLNFILDTVFQIIFILIPVVIIRWEIFREMSEARNRREDPNQDDDTHYSFLQVQSRMHAVTPYEYRSWGGSDTEDFLQAIIAFAVVTCFGMMQPCVAIIAFITSMIDYRLRAFRMVNVTNRPVPDARDGIGNWGYFFEQVTVLAVVINSLLIVFVIPPFRDFDSLTRLVLFMFIEHVCMVIFIGVRVLVPDEPEDVGLVRDINDDFRLRMRVKNPVTLHDAKFKNEKVDLRLKGE